MKLHYLDITLDDGKELIGVKTIGNTVTIVYKVNQDIRPIGYVYQQEVEDGGDNER